MLSGYGKREWGTILLIGLALTATLAAVQMWVLAAIAAVLTLALTLFYRDPDRRTPTQRGVMVSPADGHISSVHHLDHFEPFDEGATCVRIFLSVLDVHVNRSPCHGTVHTSVHTPGKHLNALNPESAEVNESILLVLVHPIKRHPVAAVRQIAGALARTVVCAAKEGQVLQRGQRFGLIKLGSTTELYIPDSAEATVVVEHGQKVRGGLTVLAEVKPLSGGAPRADEILPHWRRGSAEEAEGEPVETPAKAKVATPVAVPGSASDETAEMDAEHPIEDGPAGEQAMDDTDMDPPGEVLWEE